MGPVGTHRCWLNEYRLLISQLCDVRSVNGDPPVVVIFGDDGDFVGSVRIVCRTYFSDAHTEQNQTCTDVWDAHTTTREHAHRETGLDSIEKK